MAHLGGSGFNVHSLVRAKTKPEAALRVVEEELRRLPWVGIQHAVEKGNAYPCLEERGEWMRETLLLDVPHRQVVFTIPKTLRIFFKFRRGLLGELCRWDRPRRLS